MPADDAAEMATVEEAVRSAEGVGLQPAVWEIGAILTLMASVSAMTIFVFNGWSTDVSIAVSAVAIAAFFGAIGWVVARTLFCAGRSGSASLAAFGAVAVMAAGATTAISIGPGLTAATGFPVVLLVLGMVAPGAIILVVAHLMPLPSLRAD